MSGEAGCSGRDGHVRVDVLAIGETMVMLSPERGSLEDSDVLAMRIGGAESNVAVHLARLGYRSRWSGRVGDDPLGRRILRELDDAGVEVSTVVTDPAARTGLYLKDPAPTGTNVHYYRDDSAASRMGPELLERSALHDARVLHLSGITAALSGSCSALLRAALLERRAPAELISFDVNHRPGLWSATAAAPVLAELADSSDLVFVGQDEAERLWGTDSPEAVRERLPTPAMVVVKDGSVAAHALGRDSTVSVPALQVEVVEPVGAGDAFAAGYLAGWLDGCDVTASLRWGHLLAAQVLQVSGDLTPLPPRSWFEERLELPSDAWKGLDPTA